MSADAYKSAFGIPGKWQNIRKDVHAARIVLQQVGCITPYHISNFVSVS